MTRSSPLRNNWGWKWGNLSFLVGECSCWLSLSQGPSHKVHLNTSNPARLEGLSLEISLARKDQHWFLRTPPASPRDVPQRGKASKIQKAPVMAEACLSWPLLSSSHLNQVSARSLPPLLPSLTTYPLRQSLLHLRPFHLHPLHYQPPNSPSTLGSSPVEEHELDPLRIGWLPTAVPP